MVSHIHLKSILDFGLSVSSLFSYLTQQKDQSICWMACKKRELYRFHISARTQDCYHLETSNLTITKQVNRFIARRRVLVLLKLKDRLEASGDT